MKYLSGFSQHLKPALSVNLILCHSTLLLLDGYGQQLFEKFSEYKLGSTSVFNTSTHKPFIPGRDFAGVVRAVGEGVKHLQPGDEVMGVIPPPLPGSHAQYVVAPTCNILKKPNNLTMEEAASIPYAGLTAWSALGLTGELCINSRDKRVLVLGATGGVGMIAIQLSKIWGAMVTQSIRHIYLLNILVSELGCFNWFF